jgi:hypothetical protein
MAKPLSRYVSEDQYFYQIKTALQESRQSGLDAAADEYRDELEGIALRTKDWTIRYACRQALAEDIVLTPTDKVEYLIV